MNRFERRRAKAIMPKGQTTMTTKDFMKYAVSGMATDGPEIVRQLRENVGGRQYNVGEAVGALEHLAASMESAMLQGDPGAFSKAAIAVLFMARDIAILQGTIQPTAAPQA